MLKGTQEVTEVFMSFSGRISLVFGCCNGIVSTVFAGVILALFFLFWPRKNRGG